MIRASSHPVHSLNPHLKVTVFVALGMALCLAPILALQGTAESAANDAAAGKLLFEKRCTGCHSLDQDKEGPHLRGVYGRKAGSVPGFTYSAALPASGVVWDDTTLDKWLTDTESLVPDNDMSFHVPNPEERREIIRFLKASSEK